MTSSSTRPGTPPRHTRSVEVATLNGKPFHAASGLGFAVVVAHEREYTRRRIPFSLVLATAVAAMRALIRARPIGIGIRLWFPTLWFRRRTASR